MVVELAVTSIAIYGFLLKQERSSLLEKEPVHGDGGNGQLDNKQPPSPKSLRALSFTQNIREVANPEIESAEASTSISLNTSPARPHVDNVKSDREANSTSTNTSSTNAITKPHSENGNAFATTTTKDAALGIYNSEVISNRSTEQTPTNKFGLPELLREQQGIANDTINMEQTLGDTDRETSSKPSATDSKRRSSKRFGGDDSSNTRTARFAGSLVNPLSFDGEESSSGSDFFLPTWGLAGGGFSETEAGVPCSQYLD